MVATPRGAPRVGSGCGLGLVQGPPPEPPTHQTQQPPPPAHEVRVCALKKGHSPPPSTSPKVVQALVAPSAVAAQGWWRECCRLLVPSAPPPPFIDSFRPTTSRVLHETTLWVSSLPPHTHAHSTHARPHSPLHHHRPPLSKKGLPVLPGSAAFACFGLPRTHLIPTQAAIHCRFLNQRPQQDNNPITHPVHQKQDEVRAVGGGVCAPVSVYLPFPIIHHRILGDETDPTHIRPTHPIQPHPTPQNHDP